MMGRLGETIYTDLVARGKSLETARQWSGWMDRFEKVCGDKECYGRSDVIKYLAYCREIGLKQNSINTTLRPLKLIWQIMEFGDFPKLAMQRVRVSDINRPVLSYEEVIKMITKGKKVLDRKKLAFLALATTYGMRREEIVNLKRSDLIGGLSLKVETLKGGPVTFHKIPDEIREHLKGFETTDKRYMSRIFHSICNRVGIKIGRSNGFGWHSIRRRLATELMMRGLPSLTVVRFMRWSDAWLKGEFGMLGVYVKREQELIDEEVFKVHPFLSFWNGGNE